MLKDNWFSILTGVFQVVLAILFAVYVDYGDYVSSRDADGKGNEKSNDMNLFYPCKFLPIQYYISYFISTWLELEPSAEQKCEQESRFTNNM